MPDLASASYLCRSELFSVRDNRYDNTGLSIKGISHSEHSAVTSELNTRMNWKCNSGDVLFTVLGCHQNSRHFRIDVYLSIKHRFEE